MAEPDDLPSLDDGEEETEFATIAAADTVEGAKRKALEQLRKVVPLVTEAEVDFVVVEEGSKGGLFGRGKAEARVEARVRPAEERESAPVDLEDDDGDEDEVEDDVELEDEESDGADVLRDFVRTTVGLMGIEATVSASQRGELVRADISGDDLGLLIGRHGATIDALQYLAAIVVNGDRRERRQVVVDAEGYRERREVALVSLADRMAQKVAREGGPLALKPMTAAERKVVHLHLKDHPRVTTASEGNEPFRAVVISPRQPGA
jgi:spoIIIJ-associated protein